MARRTIHIDLMDLGSIQAAMREVEDYRRWLNAKCAELAQKLADMGSVNVSLGYARAIYDGPKDYEVSVEQRGKATYAIVASGMTVLILEFGAGVTYGAGHPQAGEFGFGPGTYPGQEHAMDPNGWFFSDYDGGGRYSRRTWGNPPSMTMYLTARDLREHIEEVAREVFSND